LAGALKAIVVSALLALSFSTPTVAGPFEDGSAAYDRNDYSTAMRHWRSLADQGNAAAQSNLALMYAKGQGVSKDYVQGPACPRRQVTRKASRTATALPKA